MMFNMMQKRGRKMADGQEDTVTALLMDAMMVELPLRGVLAFGGDRLNREMVEGLLEMINGRFLKGLGRVIRGRKK
jgi:hypothetical protein